ncbi:hypothetical protein BN14_03672 [Rhizoctonia solani AG-1 IB]|uniref:Uncharacterized protein n=1 Tax=Thanatephorus cucumeris (strain AG1-IB / isolate 7/3/14) TaxID=1108050 RepID=M5BR12_THACB|nr:hypothetical protein BN14_03672 [Rhizoctonia solani AG-1 IB]
MSSYNLLFIYATVHSVILASVALMKATAALKHWKNPTRLETDVLNEGAEKPFSGAYTDGTANGTPVLIRESSDTPSGPQPYFQPLVFVFSATKLDNSSKRLAAIVVPSPIYPPSCSEPLAESHYVMSLSELTVDRAPMLDRVAPVVGYGSSSSGNPGALAHIPPPRSESTWSPKTESVEMEDLLGVETSRLTVSSLGLDSRMELLPSPPVLAVEMKEVPWDVQGDGDGDIEAEDVGWAHVGEDAEMSWYEDVVMKEIT